MLQGKGSSSHSYKNNHHLNHAATVRGLVLLLVMIKIIAGVRLLIEGGFINFGATPLSDNDTIDLFLGLIFE